MTTASLTLRPATTTRRPHWLPRDVKAALVGLLVVPVIIVALLVGTIAARLPAPSATGPTPTAGAGLDR